MVALGVGGNRRATRRVALAGGEAPNRRGVRLGRVPRRAGNQRRVSLQRARVFFTLRLGRREGELFASERKNNIMVVPPTPMGTGSMCAGATDEFDDWLVAGDSTPSRPAAAPAPAAAAAAAAAGSSWFSSGSRFLSSAASSASAALSSNGLSVPPAILLSVPTASSLGLGTDLGGGASLLSGMTSKLKATIEDNVSQFKREADMFCTDEAQQKEIAELSQLVTKVGQTVTLAPKLATSGPAAAAASAAAPGPSSSPPAANPSCWLEAPANLRGSLERAVLELSRQPDGLCEPPAELADDCAEELELLMGCARAALAYDERLSQRRFELVPRKLPDRAFWTHYFLRVLRERRLLMLPPLKPPTKTTATGANTCAACASSAAPAAPAAGFAEARCGATASSSTDAAHTLGGGDVHGRVAAMAADALHDISDTPPARGTGGSAASARPSSVGSLDLADLEAEADRLLELGSVAHLPPAAAPGTAAPQQDAHAVRGLAGGAATGVLAGAATAPLQVAAVAAPAVSAPHTPPAAAPASPAPHVAKPCPPTPPTAIGPPPATVVGAAAGTAAPRLLGAKPCVAAAAASALSVSVLGDAVVGVAPGGVCLSADDLDAKIAAELEGLEDEDEDADGADGMLGTDRDALAKVDEDFESMLGDD